jgi:glycosyltransferase involved in cell wall biosynthesis
MSLSVIVISKNEEAAIDRCLASVRWAEELIVVDCGSTDRTLEICREHGAKVHVTSDWPGFGPQKNRALAHATGNWVLSIDADEWVSPELTASIQAVIAGSGAVAAYELQRLSSFCGRFMRHSGWWPDPVVRLFQRDKARFSDDLVHERLLVDGAVARLDGLLFHETLRNLDELLEKMNQYTTAGAQMLLERGERSSLPKAISRGAWAFFRTYVLRAGFLDGREGLMLAISTAETTYYRQLKAIFLEARRRAASNPARD